MGPLKSRSRVPARSSRLTSLNARPRKRFLPHFLIGGGILLTLLLLAGVALVAQGNTFSHAAWDNDYVHAKTIGQLTKIAVVGSTMDVVDAKGNKVTANPDPYGIAIAPDRAGAEFRKGDILVTNIGNDKQGNTIIKFANQQPTGRIFNQANPGTLGPADLVFGQDGKVWVANSTGNNVQIFNPNGTVMTTIKDPLFNGPWGIATNGKNSFFVSNKLDAKLLRIDVMQQDAGKPTFKVTQIAQFAKMPDATKIGLLWLPTLKVGAQKLTDVLLAIDPTNNRIAALANSTKLAVPVAATPAAAAAVVTPVNTGVTVFQGTPLNTPGGFALNPINGDLLVVNLADNNLVELNMTNATVVAVKAIDPLIVDNQGNNSALFGVAAIRDNNGDLRVFFTDDNTNTLNVLSFK